MSPFWLIIAAALLLTAWKAPVGKIVRGVVAIAAIAALLLGFELIDLPTIEEVVQTIGDRLGRWTYLLVGVTAFLETGAFIGFIAPGETMVLFGGVLAGEGVIDLAPLILVVWISSMLGDLTSYAIGRRYGRDFLLRNGARFKIREPEVKVVEQFFERHGDLTILLGRWVGVVRPLVPFMAGSSRMSFGRFLAVDLVATAVWATALCLLGSIFWQNFDQLTSVVGRTLLIAGTLLVVSVTLIAGVSLRRHPKRGAMIDNWLQQQREESSLWAPALTLLWATIGRAEQLSRGARRRPTDRGDTVDAAPKSGPTDEPTP